ncbi:MAG: SH3 domain-containing protein [Bdellovibrionota bacterium]
MTQIVRLAIFTCALALVPQLANAEAVCVTQAHTSLRRGPSSKDAVTWTVSENMPLLRISQKGSWSQVKDLDGQVHWVTSKSLSSRRSCAVIKSKNAKLRRGPGPKEPTADLEVADKYTPFQKIDRDGAWLLVQDEYNGRYWVNETNVWLPIVRASVSF